MQSTAQNRAYQRGLKAAGIWKGTKNRLKQWDAVCVAAAARRHLPKWAGHIPVAAFCGLSVAAILFGGFVISAIFLFLWAIFLVSPKKGLADGIPVYVTNPSKQSHSDDAYASRDEHFDDYWWWWRKK
ncbi:hypothetical protein BIY29_08650 [Brenneria alni]|uniref:DUF3742 domain-containing protein n=1 Tax=Brenneria alni TaxID=71656 RepID=A0A421DPP2_9GAMM|nr:hypothetical protein [Brenneria alni]RLM24775.1 hypothetical protein BIY29_08650 [Brenneria alni]